jgi:hypothetical protein
VIRTAQGWEGETRTVSTRLVATLCALGLDGEVSADGRWVTLGGMQGQVHVVEVPWGSRYYTWCDLPGERTVEVYVDPAMAIQAGLRRAAHPPAEEAGPR